MADEKTLLNEIAEEIDEEGVIVLQLEDGTTCECVVLNIFEVNGKDYIALLPLNPPDGEDGDVYLYSYAEDADENPILDDIPDEDYETVADAFDDWVENGGFEELMEELEEAEEV